MPGAQVVVPEVAAICVKPADLLGVVLDFFQTRGIVLHFASFQAPGIQIESLSTAGEMGEAFVIALRAMIELATQSRSMAIREGMREKQRRGEKYCRHAGYGQKWAGRKGHQRRIADEDEQAVIRLIVRWRSEGFSYYEIAVHLLRNRVKTASGREWSPSRVRRVCRVELQHLQEPGGGYSEVLGQEFVVTSASIGTAPPVHVGRRAAPPSLLSEQIITCTLASVGVFTEPRLGRRSSRMSRSEPRLPGKIKADLLSKELSETANKAVKANTRFHRKGIFLQLPFAGYTVIT